MSTAATSPGCFFYIFAVCVSIMGYLPFGHHGTDFSKDSKKLVYTYNLKEVRIYDIESRKAGEPIFTAPKGYLVDTVHWNRDKDEIYAVVHNYSRCDKQEKVDDEGKKIESKIDWKWDVEVLSVKPSGGAPRSITKKEYYCLDMQGPIPGMSDESAEPKKYHAPYQKGIEENGVNFKPTGWADGYMYYVEPEELTKRPPAVYRLNLTDGKTEKMFTLPDEGNSYMLSPSGKYIVYSAASGEKDLEVFTLVVKEVDGGKEVLREVIAKPPVNKKEKSPEDAGDIFMLLGLFTGVDGLAAFDEAAGKFFYLKLDTDAKKSTMVALDLKSGAKKDIYTGFGLAAPLPIPQKKAVLVTALDEESISQGATPMGKPEVNTESGTKVELISYDGVVQKDLKDVPPLLFPIFHMRSPDAAVSPNGNLVSLTFGYNTTSEDSPSVGEAGDAGPGDGLMMSKAFILPALIDLEKGTFEMLITKPVDYFAAGMALSEIHDSKHAAPYLDKFINAAKPGDPGFKKAAFTLFVAYQDLGMAKERDALYDRIMKEVVAGAASPRLDFSLNYLAIAASTFNDSYMTRADVRLEDLPGLERLDAEKAAFVIGELKAAEAAGSNEAAYVLACVLAKTKGKEAEAVAQFGKVSAALGGKYNDEPINYFLVTGQIYAKAGEFEKAVADFTNYLDSEVGYKMYRDDAIKARADAYEQLGKYKEAIEDWMYIQQQARANLENAIDAAGPDATGEDMWIQSMREELDKVDKKIEELKAKEK